MNILKKLQRLSIVLVTVIVSMGAFTSNVSAVGISIDVGLTPAQNRWMLRSQVRFMQRDNDPTSRDLEMKMQMFPVMVAYGVRSNLTVMVRQIIRSSEMEMNMMGTRTTIKTSGFDNLFVMGKYRLARINKQTYTIGIAPTLGLVIPTGEDEISSDSWDLKFGCFFSGRHRSLGMDLNVTYLWKGMIKTKGYINAADEFSIESAFAYQFGLGSNSEFAMAPVLEFSYTKSSPLKLNGTSVANTGESMILFSPGLKITKSSLILEGLVQIPVWQDQTGMQTERGTGFLIGFRLMS